MTRGAKEGNDGMAGGSMGMAAAVLVGLLHVVAEGVDARAGSVGTAARRRTKRRCLFFDLLRVRPEIDPRCRFDES